MDRSLALLLVLRLKGWIRRWGRGLKTVKGAVLALVGSLVFLPMLVSSIVAAASGGGAQELGEIRRYGPLALFAYGMLNLILSAGERVLYFSPAEVDFLFTGPYRPRQVLLYRMVGSLATVLLTALFLAVVASRHAVLGVSAFLGLFLGLEFLYLLTLAIGLLAITLSALVFTQPRRVAALLVAGLALSIVLEQGAGLAGAGPSELLERAEESPVVQAVAAPFRPFVMAYTAERVWPDLALWASISLVENLLLVGLVLILNAEYFETAASVSTRIYARLQRARRGTLPTIGHPRLTLPMLPWWGGIGPNFWRQLTSASRGLARIVPFLIFLTFPVVTTFFSVKARDFDAAVFSGAAIAMVAGFALFAPSMIGFDFRTELDRMEDLKTLPIRPSRLVLGQILASVTVLVAGEWVSLGLIGSLAKLDARIMVGLLGLVVPLNVVLVEIENLFFLLYPYRPPMSPSFDFPMMGRQILLGLAKVLIVALFSGAAAGLGAGAYYLTRGNWTATFATAWLMMAAGAVSLVPLLALAFTRFDVSRDIPA